MAQRPKATVIKPPIVRALRGSALAILIGLPGSGADLGYLQLSGNVHTVAAGELYRSAQPSAAQISGYATRYGIRTIVSLRGENAGRPWYDSEVAASVNLGIAHIDFRMSASRELTQEQAERLVAILEATEKPLLIHCQAGADRSGLAAALYLVAIAKQAEETAEDQLSIGYGHVGLPHLSSAFAEDRSWEKLEPWLNLKSRP
jgi:protein tyrosine/serine phosphatase